MTQERQQILLQTRQRLRHEDCSASLAITSHDQFMQYWAASASKLQNGPAAKIRSEFTESLDAVNQFADALDNAAKPARGSDIVWACTHAVIERGKHKKSAQDTLSLLTQLNNALGFDTQVVDELNAKVTINVLWKIFDLFADLCLQTVHYLRRPKNRMLAFFIPPPKISPEAAQNTISRIQNYCEQLRSSPASKIQEVTVAKTRSLIQEESQSLADRNIQRSFYALRTSFPMSAESTLSSLNLPLRYPKRHKNYFFCGREQITVEIHKNLRPSDNNRFVKSPAVVILQGLGGIGKTQTALNYTYQHENSYEAFFWLKAETPEDLRHSYVKVAQELGFCPKLTPSRSLDSNSDRSELFEPTPPSHWEHGIEQLRAFLSSTDLQWLMIFDNVVDFHDIEEYTPHNNRGHGAIICTTQTSVHEQTTDAHRVITLDSLSPSDGAELLGKHWKQPNKEPYKMTVADQDCAYEISEFVGGLPLALTTIGGFISSSNTGIQEYLNQLQKSNALWNESTKRALDSAYEGSLAKVFEIAIAALDEDSKKLLNLLAFFNPDSIPEELLTLTAPDGVLPKGLKELSLEFLPSKDYDFTSVRTGLMERQLISRDYHEQSLSIHRSLQLDILNTLSNPLGSDPRIRENTFAQAFALIRQQLPEASETQTVVLADAQRFDKYVSQLQSLLDRSTWPEPKLKPPVEFARALADAGQYMWTTGMMKDCQTMLTEAEKIIQESGQEAEATKSDIFLIQGIIEDLQGVSGRRSGVLRREEALRMRQKLHNSIPYLEVIGNDKIRLYNAEADLGCARMQEGCFDEAEKIFERCLAEYRTWDANEDKLPFEYSKYYNHMGFVLMSQNRVEEALESSRHAVSLLEKHHNPMAPVWKYYYGNHLISAGQFEESLRIHEEILESRQNESKDNRWTSEGHSLVGALKLLLGQTEDARIHFEKCLSRRSLKKWTEEGIAMARYRYSRVLLQVGETEDARVQKDWAKEIQNRFLRSEKYDDYLKGYNTDLEIYEQMITMWAGRFTGSMRQSQRSLKLLGFEDGTGI